jgi:hypothetical protein
MDRVQEGMVLDTECAYTSGRKDSFAKIIADRKQLTLVQEEDKNKRIRSDTIIIQNISLKIFKTKLLPT